MNDMPQRVPPNSIAAEGAVLGAMILKRDMLQEAVCVVNPDWFYRPVHQIIFAVLREMSDASKHVDFLTLRDTLLNTNRLEQIGGVEYLVQLTEGTPDAGNMQDYADIIREKAARRSLITAGSDIVSKAYDGPDKAESIVGDAYAALQDIASESRHDNESDIGDAMDDALEHARRVVMNEIPAGLKTGIGQLDREILSGGLREAETVVIAADTSVGKTILGIDFTRSFCRRGAGVIFASAEMPSRVIANRILSAESTVPINTIRGGLYTEDEMNRIHYEKERIRLWSLKILEGNRTIASIAASAKQMNAKWDGRLGAVVVDYLQIMEPEDRRVNREQQIGTMALRCKQEALRMGIPWIMMSQFNRAHTAQKTPPTMANLRESGQIEQHANIVILMHPTNERRMESGTPEEGYGYYEVGLMVPKNRDGNTHASWDNAIIRKVRRFCGRTES